MKLLSSIRYFLAAVLLMNGSQCLAQLPGLKKHSVNVSDSIYLKGGRGYAIRYVKRSGNDHHYYLLDSDDTTLLRRTPVSRVDRIVEAPKVIEKLSVLDEAHLIGKEILIQVTPFSRSLSRYWQMVIDDGVSSSYILKADDGSKIKLLSEMSIVNYLIGQGWELFFIQNVETGEVDRPSNLEQLFFGGNVTLSENVYFFKAKFKGR